ncbi:MAG: hypothetical protein NWS40_05385 [Crocinitomicaceae bacterium]|nr:hypothetical protein [Crocinitomicaceae bacterium]
MKSIVNIICVFLIASCTENNVLTKSDSKDSVKMSSSNIPEDTISTLSLLNNGTKKKPSRKQNIAHFDELGVELVSMASEEIPKTPPSVTNYYKIVNDSIYFYREISDQGDPRIGCSNSQTRIIIGLLQQKKDFELNNLLQEKIYLFYTYSGGLLDIQSSEILNGSIKGTYLSNGNFKLETNLNMITKNFSIGTTSEHPLIFSEEFQPN